jgi:hypothetical protein
MIALGSKEEGGGKSSEAGHGKLCCASLGALG